MLLSITIFLSFIFLEIIVRIVAPQNPNYTMFDGQLVFKHIPNFEFEYSRQEFSQKISFNSQGLRDYEYPYEKAPGTYRIVVLGDSFPEGLQLNLDKTFPKLLEKSLNEKNINDKIKKFEAINMGTGGYGTEQEYLVLKNEALKYHPDLVLLAFSMNDIEDNYNAPAITFENGVIKENKVSASLPKRMMLACSRHSDICSLMQKVIIESGSTPKGNEGFDRNSVYKKENSSDFTDAIKETLELISQMKSASENNGADFAVIFIPSKEQVDEKKMQEYFKANVIEKNKIDVNKVQRMIKEYSISRNIRVINLLDAFKKENNNNDFYFEIDGHWNEKGHELAAMEIYDELEKFSVLP